MKTFKEFLEEGILWTSDTILGGFGGKHDWWFYKDDVNTKTEFSNVSSQNYSIISNHNKYFLSNQNKDYLGSVTLSKVSNSSYKIDSADSNIKNGFYVIMLSNLLRLDNIKEIQSDRKMSISAIRAWVNLGVKVSPLIVRVYDFVTNETIDATEENYLSDPRNYFFIAMDEVHEEFFDEYHQSIENKEGYYYEKFSKKHAVVDWKLYGEFYGFMNSDNVTINQIEQFSTNEVSLTSHKEVLGNYATIGELRESFSEVFELYPHLRDIISFK